MSSESIALEVIDNSDATNLQDQLKAKLASASEVCIAIAFITESGLGAIIRPLMDVAARGKVRLVTGTYQNFTEPEALTRLLHIQEADDKQFLTHLSLEPWFHRKPYLIEDGKMATAIIGSSNLTGKALISSGELNLMLTLPKTAQPYKRLKAAFEEDWKKSRSVSLTSKEINKYKKRRGAHPPKSSDHGRRDGSSGHREPKPKQDEPTGFWRDYCRGRVTPRTNKVVYKKTEWPKEYDWYATGRHHFYKVGDKIFMFDFVLRCFSLVEVRDTPKPIPTRDNGEYFVAFEQVGDYRREFSRSLWDQLKGEGILEEDVKSDRYIVLSPEAARRLKRIMREK